MQYKAKDMSLSQLVIITLMAKNMCCHCHATIPGPRTWYTYARFLQLRSDLFPALCCQLATKRFWVNTVSRWTKKPPDGRRSRSPLRMWYGVGVPASLFHSLTENCSTSESINLNEKQEEEEACRWKDSRGHSWDCGAWFLLFVSIFDKAPKPT